MTAKKPRKATTHKKPINTPKKPVAKKRKSSDEKGIKTK